MGWRRIKQGGYNTIYINDEQTKILKIQRFNEESDTPERSVRLWNLMNFDVYPDRPAKIHTVQMGGGELKTGWICPYIEGVQANDNDISAALLQIFNRTGRIILDAVGPGNFLRTPDGKVVCVDIGLAIELEDREEISSSLAPPSARKPPQVLTRKRSEISLNIWENLESKFSQRYFIRAYPHYPKTISLITALLFIKLLRPDISNVDFLIDKPKLITLLAKGYYESQLPEDVESQLIIDALKALDDCSSSAPLLDSPDAAGGGSSGAGEERKPDERAAHTAAPRDHGLSLFAPTPPPERMDKERDKTASLGLA